MCLTRAGMTSTRVPFFTTLLETCHLIADTNVSLSHLTSPLPPTLPLYKNPLSNSRRAASQRPLRHYEFPTGFNTYFGPERFQVGELYFAHSRELVVRPNLNLSIPPFSLSLLKTYINVNFFVLHTGIKSAPPAHYSRTNLASTHGM